MHRIVCKVSNTLKRQCDLHGIESEMYHSQYDQDEELERLGVPFRILPGTDEFSRIKRRELITRNISIYTKFPVSLGKVIAFIAYVWQTVIPKSLDDYPLSKLSVRKGRGRETHKILTTSPMNVQP